MKGVQDDASLAAKIQLAMGMGLLAFLRELRFAIIQRLRVYYAQDPYFGAEIGRGCFAVFCKVIVL
ncbi:uncharacterized protein N7500_009843 [Penicillium coprophilum]|uniref:uncharacterized protein n=1 Tax=Penicillium coprophilum TaxID=36646 RepID=UPI00238DB372|nr:uncharacterized protein N7500_009843 [Penicillium coprophilum]KAJ5154404.1 hypothetical protein N7500_009843 [Penicillium coprophilum]